MDELSSGDKVKYHTGDEKWKNGAVHAVRKVDDVDGIPRVLTYLIDTGANNRVDIYKHNLKDLAHSKEMDKHFAKGVPLHKAAVLADKHVAPMPDEIVETIERQPEQVDVRPEWVKPR